MTILSLANESCKKLERWKMKDRFKYRYNNNNKIYDVFSIDFFNSTGQIVSLDRQETLMCKINLDNLIQSTGLRDKNGKLMYDGDIVRIWKFSKDLRGKDKRIIKWNDARCGFRLYTIDKYKRGIELYPQSMVNVTTIEMNIYDDI